MALAEARQLCCVWRPRPRVLPALAPVLELLQPDHQDGLSTLGTTACSCPARGPACGFLHTGCVCMGGKYRRRGSRRPSVSYQVHKELTLHL